MANAKAVDMHSYRRSRLYALDEPILGVCDKLQSYQEYSSKEHRASQVRLNLLQ